MSAEKIRDDFLSWWMDDNQEELRSSCAQGLAMVIWQASRADIEVELPQVVGYEAGFDSIRENEFASQSGELFDADEVFALSRSVEVREAIESLGLKVKP